jgi:RNA polymerase sigma-70 factor (ECF subfamily)
VRCPAGTHGWDGRFECMHAAAGDDFQNEMLRYDPQLRTYSRALTGKREIADDLVQDTLVRALAARRSFVMGTKMRAWLFKILRNCFISHLRKCPFVAEIDEVVENERTRPSNQVDVVELREVCKALRKVNPNQRSALILVAALGCSYDEAAEISGCRVGTIKSRVNRARERMQAALLRPVRPTTNETHALFVFGTLKRGFPLHRLALKDARFIGRYKTAARYPMVIAGDRFAPIMFDEPGKGHHVEGAIRGFYGPAPDGRRSGGHWYHR